MKLLRKPCHKEKFSPIFMKLAKACILSGILTFSLIFLCPPLFSIITDRDSSTDSSFSVTLVILLMYFILNYIMFVPFVALIMLIIHYTHIWPYVMYSRIFVVMVSMLFVGFFSLFNQFVYFPSENNLWLSCILVVLIFGGLRICCRKYYVSYQRCFINYHQGQTMDLVSDNIITLVLYTIVISISLVISFVLL